MVALQTTIEVPAEPINQSPRLGQVRGRARGTHTGCQQEVNESQEGRARICPFSPSL